MIHAASVRVPGEAKHSGYLLENLRFEEPAALFGVNFQTAALSNFVLRNIAMAGPEVPSLVQNSSLDDISFENVSIGGKVLASQSDFTVRRVNARIGHLLFLPSF